MNIHFTACVQSVHHQHAPVISDGSMVALIMSWSRSYQVCVEHFFAGRQRYEWCHTRIAVSHPKLVKAHDDPGPL